MSEYSTVTEVGHQAVFVERYAAIKSWAMKLAKGDRELVEDLVHDAYVQFVVTAPPLADIDNLDGYIYGLLRNLCMSHYRQSAKQRLSQLSVFDYDSAQDGLSTIDDRDQESARDELKRLCAYLAIRKDTTKSACIFVMRFLHGYFPSEIATIMRSTRAAIDVRMMSARKDLRFFLERSEESQIEVVAKAGKRIASIMPLHNTVSQDEFLWMLRSSIFDFCNGEHKSPKGIEELYKNGEADHVNVPWLSHLVSCPRCLDQVNTMFGFPKLRARFPTDALNRETKPQGKSGDDDPPSGSSGSGADLEALIRSERRVREHKPADLRVCVNGVSQGSTPVNSSENELKLHLHASERVEFVEVFSEQRVRLAMLFVPEDAAEGPRVLNQIISLSDGRELRLDVVLGAEGAEIGLVYTDPTYDEVQSLANVLLSEESVPSPVEIEQTRVEPQSRKSAVRPDMGIDRIVGFLKQGWPRFAVASLFAVAVVGIWIYLDKGQSAKAILEESEKRSITWEFEPGKVKHWVAEIETTGLTTRPDGRYLSYFWQNNIAGQGSRMIVHRNTEGQIEWGQWMRADGTQIVYSTRSKDKLTIYPNYAQLEASKAGLDDASQKAIQKYIDYVKGFTDPQKLTEGKLSYVRKMYDSGDISTEVRPNDGKVLVMRFRPADDTVINNQLTTFDYIIDVRERDYRQIGTLSTKYFKDGRVEKTAVSFLNYAESTRDEMENNEFTQLISGWSNPKYAPIQDIVDLFKTSN